MTASLSRTTLRQLEQVGSGNGVRVILFTERADIERVLEYVVAANTAQLEDAAFIAELKTWIRFSAAEAEAPMTVFSPARSARRSCRAGWPARSWAS